MVKRIKKAVKSIESIEKEKHIIKVKEDIEEGNIDRGKYHCKEIDKSLIASPEIKLKIAGIENKELVDKYRKDVEDLRKLVES